MPNSKDKNNISKEDRAVWDAYVEDMGIKDAGEAQEDDFETLLGNEDVVVIEEEELPLAKRKPPLVEDSLGAVKNNTASSFQLDRRTEEKLRKGRMPIEARLDLHGMNKAEAHESLSRFLVSCHAGALRCTLVITGKGKSKSTSDDWLSPSKGVLKENVPYWLMEGSLKEIVLKFFKAQPKDGGSGALYVYLKRKR